MTRRTKKPVLTIMTREKFDWFNWLAWLLEAGSKENRSFIYFVFTFLNYLHSSVDLLGDGPSPLGPFQASALPALINFAEGPFF